MKVFVMSEKMKRVLPFAFAAVAIVLVFAYKANPALFEGVLSFWQKTPAQAAPAAQAPRYTPPATLPEYGVTKYDTAFAHSAGGRQVGTIPEGVTLTIYAQTQSRYQVHYNGMTGWVMKQDLDTTMRMETAPKKQ